MICGVIIINKYVIPNSEEIIDRKERGWLNIVLEIC